MKITTETIKQMIREELKEMKDPYLPTAAGTAMREIFALNKAEKAYIKKYLKKRYDLDLNI